MTYTLIRPIIVRKKNRERRRSVLLLLYKSRGGGAEAGDVRGVGSGRGRRRVSHVPAGRHRSGGIGGQIPARLTAMRREVGEFDDGVGGNVCVFIEEERRRQDPLCVSVCVNLRWSCISYPTVKVFLYIYYFKPYI